MTEIRTSTLIGMAVMEALEARTGAAIMLHGISDVERERLLGRLCKNGWRRDDHPDNNDCRSAASHGTRVSLWP